MIDRDRREPDAVAFARDEATRASRLEIAIAIAVAIGLVLGGLGAAFAADARAGRPASGLEYEIYAERSGAAMRTDEPNVRRYRDRNAEPFVSRQDCENAIMGELPDADLEKGWRLQCRPIHVPAPRMVVR
jgi:hypothetical protein